MTVIVSGLSRLYSNRTESRGRQIFRPSVSNLYRICTITTIVFAGGRPLLRFHTTRSSHFGRSHRSNQTC